MDLRSRTAVFSVGCGTFVTENFLKMKILQKCLVLKVSGLVQHLTLEVKRCWARPESELAVYVAIQSSLETKYGEYVEFLRPFFPLSLKLRQSLVRQNS